MVGVTKDQWPEYVSEICRVLKPGGWAQCTESSLPMWDEGGIPSDSDYIKVVLPKGFQQLIVVPQDDGKGH
jgi:ubiquinone/menaquinone biosynthesis C-methylase UbiE